ncbi:hypothetical protein C8A01DRAFT_38846 [Parachaetomium inaequale]|uniref:MARVEL domain-containing protein n=1 Tax=Parachaetomium inaequale TaxID=2588326 RepID=A0AAN6PC69_9PEZI|nr:hypothetical protein C8A01DRAFT_38846 [Parachaetomium inaequale]
MRARFPASAAIAQLVLRVLSSACSAAALVFLVYCSAGFRRHFPIGYASATLALAFDVLEAVMLLDRARRFPRPGPGWLVLVEIVIVGFCAAAGAVIVLDDGGIRDTKWTVDTRSYQGDGADQWRWVAASLLWTVG